MAAPWQPPRFGYHLRVFAVSLVLLILCLAGFLFGVRMEAIAPATGIITAQDLQEVRALFPGLVEPGWYEGDIARPGGGALGARLDGRGHGTTDPRCGPPKAVRDYQLADGSAGLRRDAVRFHRLQPGDELWPGQVVAAVRPDDWWVLPAAPADAPRRPLGGLADFSGFTAEADLVAAQRAERRDRLAAQAVLRVPEAAERWLVVEVRAAPLQHVQAGELIATLVPIDPQTRQPRDLLARLDVHEKHFGDLAPGQLVRLFSTMFNHRLHGCAEACLEKLEPWGEPTANGERCFHARARVTHSPFPMPLGSSFKAEIIVGRKLVYRIILEH